MSSIDRRAFLTTGAVVSSLGGLQARAAAWPPGEPLRGGAPDEDRTIWLSGDGVSATPAQYTRLLARLAAEKGIAPDVVAQVLEDPVQDEEARAFDLASSKALRMGEIEPVKAFNRLTGLLVRRGYGHEIARSAARRALSLHADD